MRLRSRSCVQVGCVPLLWAVLVGGSSAQEGAGAPRWAGFTIEQALGAPFSSELRAQPGGRALAWVANLGGRRNLWVAQPVGTGWSSRAVTRYAEDDGQELGTPQWTADGGSIVYVRGGGVQGEGHPVPNPAASPGGARQQIWVVSTGGGEPRLLAEGHSPAVSPDGRVVAYVAKGQVWTVGLDAAEARPEQLLVTRGTARRLRWSPDGRRLAFVSDRGDHSFIAVYTLAARSLAYLDPSVDNDDEPAWSPDSAEIAFLRIPGDRDAVPFVAHRSSFPWSIRVAGVATARSRQIWRAREGEGSAWRGTDSEDQLQWTAGGILFPWEGDGWLHLYTVSPSGGEARLLTPGDFEVEHASLSPDRRTLVFDSNQGDIDRRHVWELSLSGGSEPVPRALTGGEGIETQPVVAGDNATVAVLRSDARIPVRPAVIEGGRLTDLAPQAIPADFPATQFVAPRQVIFPAADGLSIHGQLFLPADLKPGERRPAAIFFHGGSQRQMLLGWHYREYYSNAYAMNQYLAARGYIVLSVNYRSGIGYGMNFREALNYGAGGASEFNDVLGAGLYLRGRGDVDGSRIASWGGSYGGYLTALALARASDLFAAGVDMHGVHDWTTEIPNFAPSFDPREHADLARRAYESSPIASVSTWRSPVLLIHGDDDRNVPFASTVELVDALRRQRVDFEELVFPDEIHEFLLRRDWIRAYEESAAFLDRRLRQVPAPAPGGGKPSR